MVCVVRYSFLLIIICSRSTSFANSVLQVTSLIETVGNNITIQCSADDPQDGVFLYKQVDDKNKQEVFSCSKEGTFTPKSKLCSQLNKVNLNGKFPNWNVTILNVSATDTGFYWCEFNLNVKKRAGTLTWVQIVESVDTETKITGEGDEKVCSGDINHHVRIFLIVCAVMVLLCISAFIFVILKVKSCWANKKYKPSHPPSDSVYEVMKRSNSDAPSRIQAFINPE